LPLPGRTRRRSRRAPSPSPLAPPGPRGHIRRPSPRIRRGPGRIRPPDTRTPPPRSPRRNTRRKGRREEREGVAEPRRRLPCDHADNRWPLRRRQGGGAPPPEVGFRPSRPGGVTRALGGSHQDNLSKDILAICICSLAKVVLLITPIVFCLTR
jgi:hypothetical protein